MAVVPAGAPLRNRLLSALPDDVARRLGAQLQPIDLPLGTVLCEPGAIPGYLYFPVDAVVSLLCALESGACAETAVVGNEGAVGVALFLGGGSTPSRAVVQVAGSALRLPGTALRAEFGRHGALMRVLLRYTQALLAQTAQTALCNRHHTIDQQLCRWLLLSLDRLPDDSLSMTQELIANMLGVRREGVSEAAGKLQRLAVIEYRRGQITVRDRGRLQALSCECYAVVRREYERLLDDAALRGA